MTNTFNGKGNTVQFSAAKVKPPTEAEKNQAKARREIEDRNEQKRLDSEFNVFN